LNTPTAKHPVNQRKESISVVVAVYNIEDYICECVDSIINQTIQPEEIILVDDGSTDRSSALCDEYAEKNTNIRVIHQKNAGLSAARNTGIEHAQGVWVYFVDGDDILAPDVIESFLAVLTAHEGDVEFIQGRMTWFVDGSNNFKPDEVYIPDEWTYFAKSQLVMARMLEEKGAFRMGIRGLYRRNFLIQNDLMFVPGLYSEDQEWTPRLFSLDVKMGSNENPGYLYREGRAGSIVTARKPEQVEVLFTLYQEWFDRFGNDSSLDVRFRNALKNEAARRSVEELYKHIERLDGEDLVTVEEIVDRYRDLFVPRESMAFREKVLSFFVRVFGARSAAKITRWLIQWRNKGKH
jgi:glycosyltransferase involved in cell wall biosynthesis